MSLFDAYGLGNKVVYDNEGVTIVSNEDFEFILNTYIYHNKPTEALKRLMTKEKAVWDE